MRSNWEALIATDIYSCAFNGHVSPVATSPITAEMAEVPGLVHVSFLLLLRQVMHDDQGDNPKVDGESMLARQVDPDEATLDGTHRAPVPAVWRWRGVKPAIVVAA